MEREHRYTMKKASSLLFFVRFCFIVALFAAFPFQPYAFAAASSIRPESFSILNAGESTIGYFADTVYLRAQPENDGPIVGWIPAGTVITMAPITDAFSLTAYDDIVGYVNHVEVVAQDGASPASAPSVSAVTAPAPAAPIAADAHIVYASTVVTSYTAPQADAAVAVVYPPYTPLSVVEEADGFVQIEAGEISQFIPRALVANLHPDITVVPYAGYLDTPAILLAHPMAGAQVLSVLTPPAHLQIIATNSLYLRVQSGDLAGYVLREDVAIRPDELSFIHYGSLAANTPVYAAPDNASFTDDYIPAYTNLAFDAAINGFSKLEGTEQYVKTSAVTRLAPEEITPLQRSWPSPQPLYANTEGTLLPTGTTVAAGATVEITQMLGDFYFLQVNGVWGFIPSNDSPASGPTTEATPSSTPIPLPASTAAPEPSPVARSTQDYALQYNKATGLLTIFAADENGQDAGAANRTIPASVQPWHLPMPTGTFTLGEALPWRASGRADTLYAIPFASGCYLYGSSLAAMASTVSSGGIHIPPRDMRWLHANYTPGDTPFTIVSGTE